jgi:hypothetical protein
MCWEFLMVLGGPHRRPRKKEKTPLNLSQRFLILDINASHLKVRLEER